MSDKEAYELALVENVQRETLDAVEEAEAYKRYVNDHGWGSVSDLARKIGKSQEYVSHRLLLLRLPSDILEKIHAQRLTPWQAQELVWLKDSSLITELSHSIVEHKLTVKQIRTVRRKIRDGHGIIDAVNQVIHGSGLTRGIILAGNLRARSLDRCIKSLEKAISALNKAIDEASFCQDGDSGMFLLEKRRVIQNVVGELRDERSNLQKANRQQSNVQVNQQKIDRWKSVTGRQARKVED